MTEKRQRVEGMLHRSLPATLTIRAADDQKADDGLLRLQLSVSSETPYLRASYWDDPWIEILGHAEREVDLSRLNDGAPVLANHNRFDTIGNTPLAAIGAVEKAWLDGKRLMANIVISRRDALADLRQDITDGLVRNVSIGYTIDERTLTRAHSDGSPDEYRVNRWTPFEISPVDVPADASVGLGRSLFDAPDQKNPQSRYRVIDLPALPNAGAQPSLKGDRNMNMKTQAPAAEQQTASDNGENAVIAQRSIEVIGNAGNNGAATIAAERERVREIRAMGRQLGMADFADQSIDAGTSIDAFRQLVISKMTDSGQLRQAETAEIGMSERELDQFSFRRAILAAADPLHAATHAPFEMECSRTAQDRRGDSRNKEREAAITIPADVLNRGIAIDANVAQSVQRMFAARGMQRDLTVGVPTGGGNLVATELLGSSFIELLRNAMILDRLGVTWLKDLTGNLAIPAHTGAATGYWVTEGNAPTESQQTIGQVAMTPKTVGAYTDYTRKLLLQSSLDVEAFVRADLANIIGQTIQLAALNGSGSGAEPYGILNTAGIGSVAGGTNGAAPTYANMVALETAVATANADVGALGYVTNAKVRGKLRTTEEFASTNGKPVWTNGSERGIGSVLGYDAFVTNAMPGNLTKGTANSICSAIAFGNWADMVIGMWGGLDIMLDPYAMATSGGKRVIALQDVDIAIRRVASFAAMKDALTS